MVNTLASQWKSAKTIAEAALKKVRNVGKVGDMPSFRSNFRSKLNSLRKQRAEANKSLKNLKKIKKEYNDLITKYQACTAIANRYKQAVAGKDKSFEGPTSRGSVQDPMNNALDSILNSCKYNKLLPNRSRDKLTPSITRSRISRRHTVDSALQEGEYAQSTVGMNYALESRTISVLPKIPLT